MTDFLNFFKMLWVLVQAYQNLKKAGDVNWQNSIDSSIKDIAKAQTDDEIFAATKRLADLTNVRDSHSNS